MEYRCLGSGEHQRFGDRLQLELLGVTDGPDHEPKCAKACQCVAPASLAIYAQDKGKCNVQGTLKGAQYKQVSMSSESSMEVGVRGTGTVASDHSYLQHSFDLAEQ
jgi:hypothetical protein